MLDNPVSLTAQPYAEHRICSPEDNCQIEREAPVCGKAAMMPYDPEGAMEAIIKPGDVARLFGWIYVKNGTQADLDIKMSFRLHSGGLFIEAQATLENGEVVTLREYLPMNASYTIQLQDGKLVLSDPEPLEQPVFSKAGNRNLSRLSQKG